MFYSKTIDSVIIDSILKNTGYDIQEEIVTAEKTKQCHN